MNLMIKEPYIDLVSDVVLNYMKSDDSTIAGL